MFDSPLFLTTHDDESGGRSVPTTPLQVAAPGTYHYQKEIRLEFILHIKILN